MNNQYIQISTKMISETSREYLSISSFGGKHEASFTAEKMEILVDQREEFPTAGYVVFEKLCP